MLVRFTYSLQSLSSPFPPVTPASRADDPFCSFVLPACSDHHHSRSAVHWDDGMVGKGERQKREDICDGFRYSWVDCDVSISSTTDSLRCMIDLDLTLLHLMQGYRLPRDSSVPDATLLQVPAPRESNQTRSFSAHHLVLIILFVSLRDLSSTDCSEESPVSRIVFSCLASSPLRTKLKPHPLPS